MNTQCRIYNDVRNTVKAGAGALVVKDTPNKYGPLSFIVRQASYFSL